MKSFRNLKIGTRLTIVFSLLITLIISGLGFWMFHTQKQGILDNADNQLYNQLTDLVNIVDLQIKENQGKVNSGLRVANYLFYQQGELLISENEWINMEAVNQITKETIPVHIKKWYLGGNPVYLNFKVVDKIMDLTDATSTIFQKIDQGYLRISTNVLSKEGKRAVGTFIPNDSPVIKAIEKGETYRGRAFVVNDWYLTAYEPIKIDGEIQGILYVGVKEKELDKLKDIFESKKFFEDGYPYMVSDNGMFIIHPKKQGENYSHANFFQQMVNSGKESGKTRYEWEGRWKYQFFQYYEPIKAYIAATMYEETLFNHIASNVAKTRNTVLLVVAGTLTLFFIVIYLFSRNMSQAFEKVMFMAERIAQGDLTVRINIKQKDELGKISDSLNQMAEKLREVVAGVTDSSEHIASSSLQVSSSSQQLSQGTSEQASSLEEISSSMEEMAANIEQNSSNAGQTAQIASEAVEKMHYMGETGKKSMFSISSITERISIINDIAFQTNILALNAAVEAARAGEFGKGFAVVADEVKKLAERSKIAADEIIELSKATLDITNESKNLIDTLVPKIENTSGLVNEINTASLEQRTGSQQINSSIQELNKVLQQTASSSEELASNAEALSSQAMGLRKLVSFFKIGNNETSKSEYLQVTKPTRITQTQTKKEILKQLN